MLKTQVEESGKGTGSLPSIWRSDIGGRSFVRARETKNNVENEPLRQVGRGRSSEAISTEEIANGVTVW